MSCISKNEQFVTLEYELPSGCTASEEYDVPTLYDFWVRMYKKRTTRIGDAQVTA